MLTIVFDLDGTLIDTAPDLIDTLNFTLAQHGLPAVLLRRRPADDRRRRAGHDRAGIGRSGTRLHCHRHRPPLHPFVAHYAEHMADRSRPFPHLEAALDRLAGAGHRLAVCTNKLEWLSKQLLAILNLSQRFAAICGQDTFGVQKPDPQIFRATVMRAGGKPERAIMVGDFDHRYPHRPRRERPGRCRRFRLYRRADCDLAAGPGHQFLRRTAGGHRRSRACEKQYGRSGLYRAQRLIISVPIRRPMRLIWSRGSWKRLPMDSVDVEHSQAREFDEARERPTLVDPFGRDISYLRVSVTDRCDFRCVYCMSEHMAFLPKADLLTLEELDRLCSAFVDARRSQASPHRRRAAGAPRDHDACSRRCRAILPPGASMS